ncbi:MAG: hypothetical protein VX893_15910 [Candidatus Latescibacterota bacterium]|nr:hypothetical protein [Candidatus Latescibacterota bacterium]
MKTLILEEPGKFKRVDTPEPGKPGPGQALLQVQRVASAVRICTPLLVASPFLSIRELLGTSWESTWWLSARG